jgi:hypothetical protein
MPRKKEKKSLIERGGKPVIIGRNLPPFNNNNNKNPQPKQPKAHNNDSLSHTMHVFKEGAPVALGRTPLLPQSKTVFPQGRVQTIATAAATAAVAADEARRNTAYGAGVKRRPKQRKS